MTDNSSLFWISLKERALHEIAKACWGDYSFSNISIYFGDEEKFMSIQTEKLIAHRKLIVNIIPKLLTFLPKSLMDRLIDAVILMQRGYTEALVCTNIYRSHNKLMPIFPLSPGPYAAKNFIDPTGCFDEIKWAKVFVRDDNQSIFRRFELACFYCFEGVIKELWSSMKHIGRSLYEGSFEYVRNMYGCMVWIWAHHLENKFESLTQFYFNGFLEANDRGFEYAARFFWNGCPDTEKEELLRLMEEYELSNDEFFCDPSQFKHEGHVYFFYSLLSEKQKQDLVSLTAPIGAHFLWSRLVMSKFYKSVLKDIQTIPFPTSSLTYACVLNELTLKMRELPIPAYGAIFKALWKPLSETEIRNILGLGLNIISNLAEIKSVDLLKIVIEPLSQTEKEWMLIHDWQSAGISAMCRFLTVYDYDGLRRYLLLFLMDRNRVTQQLSVRVDAIDFFNRFIGVNNNFLVRNGSQIPEYIKCEIGNVLDSIEGSLLVLKFLQV